MSCAVKCFVHAIHKRSKKCLVQKDGFPWFKHHSVALCLLYNMSLEPSFPIEQFQRYTWRNSWKCTFDDQVNETLLLCHTKLSRDPKLYWCLAAFRTSLYHSWELVLLMWTSWSLRLKVEASWNETSTIVACWSVYTNIDEWSEREGVCVCVREKETSYILTVIIQYPSRLPISALF